MHSADDLIEIRDLRNEIAHKYLLDALHVIIPEVLKKCVTLEIQIEVTRKFLIDGVIVEFHNVI